MISFLTRQPLWLSGLLLVGLATALAMLGPSLVRRYVTLEKLTTNHEVAGFKFAVVGVLYAVLVAFAIIVVWEKFNEAENNVAQEAGAAATVYRLSQGVGEQPGTRSEPRSPGISRLRSRMIGRPWNTVAKAALRSKRSIRFIVHYWHSVLPSNAIPPCSPRYCASSTS